MSRLAKKPIKLPEGITVIQEGGFVVVKGPKGEKKIALPGGINVKVNEGKALVESTANEAPAAAGTTWALLVNAIQGVARGFSKILEMEGVGYRAALEGKNLVLYLGYAQPTRISLPDGVAVKIEKNTVIEIAGIDKELVGLVAAKIRLLKKPEPYKGKGIHYRGEVIRRKVGKKAGATAAT